VSLRDPKKGSWFIQTLCKVLKDHGTKDHLENILKITSKEMSKLKDEKHGNNSNNFLILYEF